MRVTFDSNAWEKVFRPDDKQHASIQSALSTGTIRGFICDIGFRIEAIRKIDRASYFEEPRMEVSMDLDFTSGGIRMSMGPRDDDHPGLPEAQRPKLAAALEAGMTLIRGSNWMGLPSPSELRDPDLYVRETKEEGRAREQRQTDANAAIEARGLGKAAFDAVGGWTKLTSGRTADAKFARACAEWVDGELVAAHIAYRNDLLCTDDHAKAGGPSVFSPANRAWLNSAFGVAFIGVDELSALAS